ncbi:hypothetical protein [Chitinimonas taiwanensis]|uniref:hypothetical protein n=1 Tax=Chitinimonas taiwanensis TaxID=240412 RepID=UPI0035ADFEC3
MSPLLRIALLLTVGLSLYLALEEEPAAPPQSERPRRVDASLAAAPLPESSPAPTAKPASADHASAEVDLFASQSWLPPPPPPSAPPAAVAPPLPFSVDMVWQDASGRYLALGMGGVQLVVCERCQVFGHVHPGGLLGERYRLEAIEPGRLVFTYLPLNTRQTLSW